MPTVSHGLYKWLVGRGATLEDFADRLNHFWTFGLLLLFACIVSWKQGYNRPINCWVPAEFTDSMVRYAEQTCWNSYFIAYPRDKHEANKEIMEMFNYSSDYIPFMDEDNTPFVASEDIDEDDSLLTKMSTTQILYQWFPIILCFQALLFKLPNLLMYILHGYSGVTFEKVAGVTGGYRNTNLQDRGVICRQIARYIFNWCLQFRKCLSCRLLTFLWLFIKVLYLVNAIVQMSLVDGLLKTTDPPLDNSTSYGDVIGGNLMNNNASLWKFSPAFPRRVYCDFQIRRFMNIHRYTVQCHLTINYFNEFVYMFLWIWLLVVALVTCLSLVMWMLRVVIPVFRTRYIRRALATSDDIDTEKISRDDLNKFCDVIGEDGVMLLKLISANSSEILISNVVSNMYRLHIGSYAAQGLGQVLSVPEVKVQPNDPMGEGKFDETKTVE